MKILFVDDVRDFESKGNEVTIVRTVEEAKAQLTNGVWDEVYLDHDLGLDQKLYEEFWTKFPDPADADKVYDYAMLTTRPLVEWIIEHQGELDVEQFYVHSGNPVGANWLVRALLNETDFVVDRILL